MTYVCLDLLGPVMVKAMNNKRSKLKCYPLLIVFQSTGAVHMELMSDYLMFAFLLQWWNFVSVRGRLDLIVLDYGLQLTSEENVIN